MIWGAISAKGRSCFCLWLMPKGTTINSKVYLKILKEKLQPHMNILGCSIFQQDGAPVHTAKIVKTWLQQQGIELLDWPGSSPDLNVIENCWTVVKREVAKLKPVSASYLEAKI